jgi:Protein of unknown function (DUF1569)
VAALHDPKYKSEILRRLQSLRPDSERRWGKMSVAQMLWHVNEAMEGALGRIEAEPLKVPLPRPLLKWLVLNAPWGKGAPTLKRWVPQGDRYDFASERDRCCRLVEELASKPLSDAWPDSATLGRMSGNDVSRLHAKHLNHHLTQFGL